MSGILRNTASQKWRVYAWDATTGLAKTGDAANISAHIQLDDASSNATNDTNPTEASSSNQPGYYDFDLTQAETNAQKLSLSPKSGTSNINVIACPPVVYTIPPAFSTLTIANNAVDADLERIKGDAQSVTDAKDFFDDGYDPSTNKVQGVVTTDTATNVTTVNGLANNVITAASIAADAITDAKVASDVTIASGTGAVGSVTGAVGSVTGNVGGNVTGSVGSVVGAVGSVTGNVGGNVTGSVGSVSGNVSGSIGSLAAQAKADVNAEADTALADAGVTTTVTGRIDAAISTRASQASVDDLPTNLELAAALAAGVVVTTNNDKTGYSLTSSYDFSKGTTAMAESYAANGAAPTPAQALFAIHQMLMQFSIASTTLTVKKLDNSTTAFLVTLSDATNPTGATRT